MPTQIQVLPSGNRWKMSHGEEFDTQPQAIDAARRKLESSGAASS